MVTAGIEPQTPVSDAVAPAGGEALTAARVILFVRAHGVAGCALLIALYAMGFFSRAQTLGCGV